MNGYGKPLQIIKGLGRGVLGGVVIVQQGYELTIFLVLAVAYLEVIEDHTCFFVILTSLRYSCAHSGTAFRKVPAIKLILYDFGNDRSKEVVVPSESFLVVFFKIIKMIMKDVPHRRVF